MLASLSRSVVAGLLLLLNAAHLGSSQTEATGKQGYSSFLRVRDLPRAFGEDLRGVPTRCRPWERVVPPEDMHHGFLRASPVIVRGPQSSVVITDYHPEIRLPCEYANANGTVEWQFKPSGLALAVDLAEWSNVEYVVESRWAREGNSLVYKQSVDFLPELEGYYRCKVRVEPVGSVISNEAHIRLSDLSGRTGEHGSVSGVRAVHLTPGSSLLLPCSDVGNDWSSYERVTWRVNNVVIAQQRSELTAANSTSAGSMLLDNGALYLWDIPESMNGSTLQCCVASAVLENAACSGRTLLLIGNNAKKVAPASVRAWTASSTSATGGRIVLVCDASNFDSRITDVSWTRNGYGVSSELPLVTTSDVSCDQADMPKSSSWPVLAAASRVLVLCRTDEDSQGTYSCAVTTASQVKATSNDVPIVVQDPPHRVGLGATEVLELPTLLPTDAVQLNCSQHVSVPSGPATTHVVWYYNGEKFKHGQGAHAYTLHVNASYPGLFQCTVQNVQGRAEVMYRVRVSGEPSRVEMTPCVDVNVVCFRPPESFERPITRYVVGQRNGRYPRYKVFWHYDVTRVDHRGIVAELCQTDWRSWRVCNVLVTACSELGCSAPSCFSATLPGPPPPLGFSAPRMVARNESVVDFHASVHSGHHFICNALFRLQHPNGSFVELASQKLCHGTQSDGGAKGQQLKQSFSSLESCISYRGCVTANLSAYHAGLDISDIGSLHCKRTSHSDEPAANWVTVTTPRSVVPKKDPVIVKTFRLDSEPDALVLWKPSQWCDILPDSMFRWTHPSDNGGQASEYFYHRNNSMTVDTHTQLYRRGRLSADDQYSVRAWSCAQGLQPVSVSENDTNSAADDDDADSSDMANASRYSVLEPERTFTRKCSGGVVVNSFQVPAIQSVTIAVDNRTGSYKIYSNWTVDEDLQEHIEYLFVNHSCSHAGDAIPISQFTKVPLKSMSVSKEFKFVANETVECNVSLSATFRNYGSAPAMKLSPVQLVTAGGNSISDLISNSGSTSEGPSAIKDSKISDTVSLEIGAAALFVAMLLLILAAIVRHRRRRKHSQSQQSPGSQGNTSDRHIYEEVMQFFPTNLPGSWAKAASAPRPAIPTPTIPPAVVDPLQPTDPRTRRVNVYVNKRAEREGVFGAYVDDDTNKGDDIEPYDTTSCARVLHQLKTEAMYKRLTSTTSDDDGSEEHSQ
ncbi:uncharacterized protein LOC135815575 [Sycon ciliatum]|uniref:uncharacterized protein LOC135815575 n=1 Tax=Sycon ciliatum TaxID=27933 RepID=UPI0031F6192E